MLKGDHLYIFEKEVSHKDNYNTVFIMISCSIKGRACQLPKGISCHLLVYVTHSDFDINYRDYMIGVMNVCQKTPALDIKDILLQHQTNPFDKLSFSKGYYINTENLNPIVSPNDKHAAVNLVSGYNQYFPVSWILCQEHYQWSLKLLSNIQLNSISGSM